MSKSVPAQHPAVVLRSQYRNLRSLVAVLLIAVVSLSVTVAVIAIDDDGTGTATSGVANGRTAPTLEDPFQTRTQPSAQSRPDESAVAAAISQAGSPLGRPDESAVAAAISPQTGVSAPDESKPDESKIAASLADSAETGPDTKWRAWQEKLDSMTPQQQAEAFVRGH